MSEAVLIAVVASLPSTLLALATLIVSVRNSQKVEQVQHATNSLMDRLIVLTRTEAHAAGVKEEKERGR